MSYISEKFGGLGLNPEWLTNDLRVELLEKGEPLLLAALGMATRADCPFEVRAALYSYRSNTAFRGMLVNDLLMKQIKSVFTTMAPDTLTDESIRVLCGISTEEWGRMRVSNRHKMAATKGYIHLGQALELLQRPTYFKQILTRESSKISDLENLKQLSELQTLMVDEMIDFGLTKEEHQERFPQSKIEWMRLNTAFNAESWRIQTDSKNQLEFEPAEVKKSFSTIPWPLRRRNILRNLKWFWPDNQAILLPDLKTLSAIVAGEAPVYTDNQYVKRARFNGLASLETPLY